jgi:hypothetical protein
MPYTTEGSVDPQTHIQMEHARAQRNFAMIIFVFAFVLLLVVSLGGFSNEKLDPQMVFTTITTLVGTWVGTLLAFYYARENFESASRSMQQTISKLGPSEKLHSVQVVDAMIDRTEMIRIELKPNQKPESLKLSELVETFKKEKLASRLPVLNADGSIAVILHESLLNLYLRDYADPNGTATLDDFSKYQENAKMLKLFGTIARDRTLRDAKTAMESQKGCQDVFVTATGAPGEPVVGWITNGRILLALDA